MSAVDTFLKRLNLAEAAENAQAKGIERIVSLRGLSPTELMTLVNGNQEQFETLSNALKNRGPAERAAPQPAGRMPDEDIRDGGRGRGRGGRGRGRGQGSMDGGEFRGRGRGGRGGFRPPASDEEAQQRGVRDDTRQITTDVTIPWDSVKWLLAQEAKKLLKVHHTHNTTNSKIEKPEAMVENITFTLYGHTEEAVQRAKADILKLVGSEAKEKEAARFDYVVHELERNVETVTALCAANLQNKGSSLALSENVLKRLVGSFTFNHPQSIQHFCNVSAISDKDKFDFLQKCTASMKGVQMIIFTEPDRVVDIEKYGRPQKVFGIKNVCYIHRGVSKEERLKRLEEFKKGAPNDKGVKCRVLVTTIDYAKLARKVVIPYANFVVHFKMPKTKEAYLLQSQCCGRQGTNGISLLFYQTFDLEVQKSLATDFEFVDYTDAAFETAVGQLKYDMEKESLTPEDAEPPANWRELLEQEKAEKAKGK